jgi:hypothetical protein
MYHFPGSTILLIRRRFLRFSTLTAVVGCAGGLAQTLKETARGGSLLPRVFVDYGELECRCAGVQATEGEAMQVYQSDDEWRIVVIMNLVKIREAIYELGVGIGFVAVGAAFDKWWDGAFRLGAAAALLSLLVAALTARKHYARLEKLWSSLWRGGGGERRYRMRGQPTYFRTLLFRRPLLQHARPALASLNRKNPKRAT